MRTGSSGRVPGDRPAQSEGRLPGVVLVSLHTSPLDQPGGGDAGGMNVYVRHLARSLAAVGHPVRVLTRQDGPSSSVGRREMSPGVVLVPVPAGPPRRMAKEELLPWVEDFAAAGLRVLEEDGSWDRDRPVVLHAHYWLSGLAGARMAASLGAPLVHTMHTLAAVKQAQHEGSDEVPERAGAERRLARQADLLVANSPAEREELIRFLDAPPDRIEVVPPGVDGEVFTPEGPAVWPGRAADLRLLFAGRIQPHKGPQIAVAALGELSERRRRSRWGRRGAVQDRPSVSLHLTGAQSGATAVDLPALARQLGVEQQCTVSPPLRPEQLAAAYRAADAVLVPSHSESFGLVALEAQACGTPVLAHRAGGLVHAVDDGVTGRLVDSLDPARWADELERMLADPGAWTALGPAAARRAQRFEWGSMARTVSGLYARVSGTGRPAKAPPRGPTSR